MPTIQIELDDDAYAKLEKNASSERRVPAAQAEVLLLMSLGLWPVKATPKGVSKPQAASAKPMRAQPGDAGGVQGISHGS
jgi:hypothetical protein